MSEQPQNDKPTLHLLHPQEITFENIVEMFRQLTGWERTPEEIEEAQTEWEKAEQD